MTLSDIPMDEHPMKRTIFDGLNFLINDGRLKLKPTKKKSIIDFIASVPEMTSKAVTRNNILHGFKENGMVDSKLLRYPDFDKMLATCRLYPIIKEYDYRCSIK